MSSTSVSPQQETGPTGRPTRAYPLSVELARQLRRRRTLVIAGLLAALPVIVLVALTVGSSESDGSEGGGGPQVLDVATQSGVNFTAAMLFLSAGFFLVIPVALFFGDSVAAEASWSSLRYLLAAPVPRARLVLVKAAVALLCSFAAVVLLGVVSLVVGTLAYGTGPLSLPTAAPVPYGAAVGRLALALVYILLSQLGTAGLALWLSTRTDAPLGAVGGAMGLHVVMSIVDQVSALGSLREVLPAHWDYAWFDLLQPVVDPTAMTKGVAVGFSYGVVLLALAIRGFAHKDVVS